ncbi:MAG: radical SAM protein [Chloroflexi bacterium]|nr:MAG: radical SAM protein [Chloroflexota bacterium]
MPAKEATPFSQALDRRVEEGALGTLYEKLPDNQVRCYACAHRCLIKEGLRGICKVRYNRGGTLMVPRGYVGALQCDPIEKKPFFHAVPGTDALTFGMLGCDLHCTYCFARDVRVATNAGMRSFAELWDGASDDPDGDPSRRQPPNGLTATSGDGSQHNVRWVFRHDYEGELVRIWPFPLVPFDVTPDHPVLATEKPGIDRPRFVSAGKLTPRHHVCVPVSGDLDYLAIRETSRRHYRGPVFNLETDGPHTYLANHAVVHNCQNWVTSQALRDPGALSEPMDITPRQLVDIAQRQQASVVATSYNEPLITSEWAVEVFKEARPRGFMTAYISNGNATREVLEYIRPFTDLYKIDLKSFRDKNYRSLGGKLENIVNGIQMVHEMGFWLEIVTLIIPGFNDSDEELGDIAHFLAGLSPSIPWHVTAFHKDYRMQDPDNTTPQTLLRAAAIGEAAGLQYIYAGNLPGRVGRYEDTRCPSCQTALVRRFGYRILEDRLTGRGACHRCGFRIPGIWSQAKISAGRAY